MTISLINDNDWDDQIINNTRPSLVTFISPHCHLCSMIGWELEQTAVNRPNINIRVLDVAQSPDTKNYYGIDGTPRSILFQNGKEIATLRGFQRAHVITQFIDANTKT